MMESPHHQQAPQQPLPGQALPSITSLTNGLPPTSQPSPHGPPARDSGAWLNPQSKHTSVNSGLHVSTLLNPEESQVRGSVPSTPTSSRLSHPNQLPSINHGHEGHAQRDSLRQSVEYHHAQESRRSSVDSRMHSGFNNLAINPMSPYESQHPSQVSLAASLRRPEGQHQLSPLSSRSQLRPQDSHSSTRVAPPIVPNPRQFGAPDPTSSRPVQGFPWAFPDALPAPDERPKRRSSSSESDESQKMSRQNSFAASSVRSSVFSAEMPMLPAGQRKFEDGMAFQKIIGPIGDEAGAQDPSMTHHHSMQHRAVTALQNQEGTPGGYSRTPELRVSHKLAERKRRSEMKDLFEELNKAVPTNGGAKASKWEILSKAIDYIRSTREQERHLHEELQRQRRDLEYARELQKDNEQLRTEVHVMQERLRRLEPNNPHIYGAYTSHLTQQQGQPAAQQQHISALPPMHSSHPHPNTYAPQSGSMQGVEYALPARPSYEVR
ncbi:helix-loop-helix DNA-binding domain-containing protein 2 [Elsinoe australis]|uniref:Helix-loop-helix DNA-binding domain-containing protein 2 n=1 Tax=Elsinoe australis TaxID=40998 RepID=A0A4U7B795_9PEZI|nr:helix-loop-helix DNA-binding domain-containing protein 2 [Elsinoe australis]